MLSALFWSDKLDNIRSKLIYTTLVLLKNCSSCTCVWMAGANVMGFCTSWHTIQQFSFSEFYLLKEYTHMSEHTPNTVRGLVPCSRPLQVWVQWEGKVLLIIWTIWLSCVPGPSWEDVWATALFPLTVKKINLRIFIFSSQWPTAFALYSYSI